MNAVSLCPPVASPATVSAGLMASWIEGWDAALTGWTQAMGTMLSRGPAALLDLSRWLELTSGRRRPAWHSPHELVFETPGARLRDFSVTRGSARSAPLPVLVLPPQAGH